MNTVPPLLAIGALVVAGCSAAPRVAGGEEACALAKSQVAKHIQFAPGTRIASCEPGAPEANPAGYYVLALHSDRQCEDICSTNLGWYGVAKSTGEVFDWDISEDRPIQPVSRRR